MVTIFIQAEKISQHHEFLADKMFSDIQLVFLLYFHCKYFQCVLSSGKNFVFVKVNEFVSNFFIFWILTIDLITQKLSLGNGLPLNLLISGLTKKVTELYLHSPAN